MTETRVYNDAASMPTATDDYLALARLWILRILAETGAQRRCLRRSSDNGDLMAFLGYTRSGKQKKEEEWAEWLATELANIEKAAVPREGPLFQNIGLLAGFIGLSPVEQEILAFCVVSRTNDALIDLMQMCFWHLTDARLARVSGTALGLGRHELEEAIRLEGTLFTSGLMQLESAVSGFHMKLACMSGLPNALLRRNGSIEELINFAVSRSSEPRLAREDYPHLARDIDLLVRYLGAARGKQLAGVNVLLYGPPGVGKTEFVRLVARELSMRLYEVNMVSRNGAALSARERFDAYLLNQRIFAQDRNVLVLFDEVEDVFLRPTPSDEPAKPIGRDKAWVNRLLETNPVPAIWVTNRTWYMDAAHLRRFDYVLEMRNPPRSVRRGIAARYLKDFSVTESWLDSQSEREEIAPALLEKAARVVRHAALSETPEVESCLNRIIRNSLEVQGSFKAATYPTPGNYRPEFINTDVDVLGLPASLKKAGKGRLLLHGAPGTGKTAFAHYLAKTLDRPLTVRRASDIQSMWVGGTEKNIARMFRDASDEDAVLLLDEADSFLQDRRLAMASWEVSHVNELLTQMECFRGIFLCATNFLDHLDTASIRRFGLKIRFDYLTAEQRWAMFEEYWSELGNGPMNDLDLARSRKALDALTNLTPGDFAAVRQHFELVGKPACPADLVGALRAESELKPDGQKRVLGFVG